MELKLCKEYDNKNTGYSAKSYKVDDTVQQENFCDLLKSFENDTTRFYYCTCNTYNEKGSPICPTFRDLDKMRVCPFDNPDISFMANFIDRDTQEYKFSIISSINSDIIKIVYNPTIVFNVRHKLDTDRMFEELKKNREQTLRTR